MRKVVVVAAVVGLLSSAVAASDFYFDIGVGFGAGFTSFSGNDIAKALKEPGVREIAMEAGFKLGYGLFGDMPLYGTFEFGGIAHDFERSFENSLQPTYIRFNSYLIGPGMLYYPIGKVQLAASVGLSFMLTSTNAPHFMGIEDGTGFAWSLSGGYELGPTAKKALVGVKYFVAHNKLETSRTPVNSSMYGIFVRYAFCRRP